MESWHLPVLLAFLDYSEVGSLRSACPAETLVELSKKPQPLSLPHTFYILWPRTGGHAWSILFLGFRHDSDIGNKDHGRWL